MTPHERNLLEALFERIRSAPAGGRDAEAEAFIAEAMRAAPAAPYLLSQTVIVQEETLKAAAQRIEELQARVSELESRPAAAPTSFLGGIGRNIFGEETPRAGAGRGSVPSTGAGVRPPEPSSISEARWTQRGEPIGEASPRADSSAQPGGGGSFLKGALGAAAGVAGGMLLANSLSGLFGQNNPFGSTPAKAEDNASGDKPWGAARDNPPSATPASHQDEASDSDDEYDDDEGDDGWDDGDDV